MGTVSLWNTHQILDRDLVQTLAGAHALREHCMPINPHQALAVIHECPLLSAQDP